ncbi:MAG: hypothetical protein ACXAEN_27435 [Candidatus Thorarchaeota archaeon]
MAKAGDRGLKKAIDNDLKKIRRERKAKRDNERIEAAMALYEANKDYLATLPHPMDFTDRETGEALTFVDYVEYMKKCCGVSGMLRVNSTSIEEYKAKLDRFKRERMAR